MKFRKYNSLDNAQREVQVVKAYEQGLAEQEYVATEKVHGANFSIWYDGTEIKTAKRSGFCDGTFFSSYKIAKYFDNVKAMYNDYVAEGILEVGDTLVIYGEIFGGNFFGNSEANAKNIQGGMNYHPDTEFIAFDIGLEWVEDGESNKQWLPYEMMVDILGEYAIPVVPEIGRGTLREMLALNNEYNTLVPALFGLETPEGEDNICEGNVIRPVDGEQFYSNGSRVIFKSKNSKFSENNGGTGKSQPVDNALPTNLMGLFGDFTNYLNRNRLQAVQSKIGEPTWKEIQKVAGLMVQDAMEDFDNDHYATLKEEVGLDDWTKFNKQSMRISLEVVRTYYKEVI